MADDSPGARGVFDTLLAPLRLPGEIVGNVETLARSVVALQRTAEAHLASIDARAGELVAALSLLQKTVTRLETKVDRLAGLEATIDERMEVLRADLNTRMLSAEEEVHLLRTPLEQVARDVASIKLLLPDPSDGPMARLRDTLTSS
ncbi:MAG: hypothetical protein ACR2KV_14610 [Solirubrobacteraceae bacterium]